MRKQVLIILLASLLSLGMLFAGGQQDSAGAAAGPEAAESWPSGPINIVCSSRAGGFADYHARVLADYIQRTTGTPCAVINIAEGGGSVGAEKVRSSKPDGLTLYYMHTSFPISCYTGIYNADPDKDFTAISSVVNAGNNALVVRGDAPWNNFKEFVADAKRRPGEIIWGAMAGATSHFVMAIFEREAGVEYKMVDAGTEAEKITMLLGGHIDICNVGMGNMDQYVKTGQMKSLGVTGQERDFAFPDYPTVVEQGYDVVWEGEFALYGPAGMSVAMVEKINTVLDGFGTTDQASREAIEKRGGYVIPRTTEESVAYIRETHAMLKNLAVELGF